MHSSTHSDLSIGGLLSLVVHTELVDTAGYWSTDGSCDAGCLVTVTAAFSEDNGNDFDS